MRPNVEALAKNRHFFAAEAIEAIFMQLFLLEVRKRTDVPSIIWLHDGLWIGRAVDDQILYAAERHVRQLLFPNSDLTSSLFSITSLYEDWQAVVSTCPPPLTLRCLGNARKAPDGVGEDGRLPDSFLLPNSAIDKLLNASSRATLTGLTSAPAFAGVNTLHPMFGRFLVSGSPVCSAFEKFRLFGILSGFLGWFVVGFRMYWSLCQRMHDMPLLCTVKGLLSLLPARSLGRLGILGLNHFPGSGRLSSSPLMRSLATLVFCC